MVLKAMITEDVEVTIVDDNNDDGIIIVRHDLGDAIIDQHRGFMKGRCVGRDGFIEQMNVLSLLHHRRGRA